MKIQAKNESIKSMKLSVPIDGLIEIDSDGVAEVSSQCGKMLIEGTSDWEEFGDSKKTLEKKNETPGKKSIDDEIIEGLNKLSLEDCIKAAKEAGYPEKEWDKLSKNEKAAEQLMRKYLVKKYKQTIKK